MTNQNRLQTRLAHANRAVWTDAARDMLIAGGIAALSLRGLATSLGVTTGAFYSVFSGLEDLHEALRERWREQNTLPLAKAMTEVGEDGFRQYLAGLRVTILEGDFDPRFDNAIREWAHSSPRTAEVLAEVEAMRIDLLIRMFLALGFDEKRAQIRARITYFHQVGYTAMEIHDRPDERLLNLRFYAEALIGRSDLMVCKTAEEIRQFILTGQPPRILQDENSGGALAKGKKIVSQKLVLVRHGNESDDDRVHSFALMNGFEPVTYRPFKGDCLPSPARDLAGTVIFGGRQSAENDADCPYLADERRWIRNCIAADVPILGICLGAQLIIRELGGRVGALNGELHEFGYYPVTPTKAGESFMPEPLHVTEAHYHTFTLPDGVELLATGSNYVNQAFRYGDKVYGVQFHPECTIEIFRRWQQSDWAPYGKRGAQDVAEQNRLMAEHDAAQGAWFNGFLARLFKGDGRDRDDRRGGGGMPEFG